MELKLTQGGAIHWVADKTGDSEAQKEWPTVNSLKSLSRQADVLFFFQLSVSCSSVVIVKPTSPPGRSSTLLLGLHSLYLHSSTLAWRWKTFTSFVLFLSFLLFSLSFNTQPQPPDLKISQQVEPPCCKPSCINSNLWTASDHIKEKKITGYKWHQLTFWCQEIWDQHRWTQLSYFSWLFENTAWLLQSLTVAALFFFKLSQRRTLVNNQDFLSHY